MSFFLLYWNWYTKPWRHCHMKYFSKMHPSLHLVHTTGFKAQFVSQRAHRQLKNQRVISTLQSFYQPNCKDIWVIDALTDQLIEVALKCSFKCLQRFEVQCVVSDVSSSLEHPIVFCSFWQLLPEHFIHCGLVAGQIFWVVDTSCSVWPSCVLFTWCHILWNTTVI